MRPTHEELQKILAAHKLWLCGADGRCANLRGADLSYIRLSGADLRYADLKYADLRFADLDKADLRSADLRSSILRGADLSGANLRGADLRSANLSEVLGIRVAACHWSGHGECGRLLNAVELPDGLRFYCGCFSGNEEELRYYINTRLLAHAPSRTKALDFLLSCF